MDAKVYGNNNDHETLTTILNDNTYRWTTTNQTSETLNSKNMSHHNIHVWVYVPKHPIPPDASHPILQSYVDIILRGCFNTFGEPLARSFVSTTTGWFATATNQSSSLPRSATYHYWVNDRDRPMYKRADRVYSKLNAAKIDRVLFDELDSMVQTYSDPTTLPHPNSAFMYCRNTYDPLFHLEQLTHCLEQDYDSVHPMAFQHFASQIRTDQPPKTVVG